MWMVISIPGLKDVSWQVSLEQIRHLGFSFQLAVQTTDQTGNEREDAIDQVQ